MEQLLIVSALRGRKVEHLVYGLVTSLITYEFTGLLPAKTRTDRNGPANAQASVMIQLLPRSNPEFTISYGFCIEMCGMFIFVAIA